MTDEQKKAVEDYVNAAIASRLAVSITNEPKDQARASGVE